MIARRQEILVNPVSTFNVNAYEGEILYNAFGIFDTEVIRNFLKMCVIS